MTLATRLLPSSMFTMACWFATSAHAGLFDPVTYELLPGSFIADDCRCGRPPIQKPLEGTCVLTREPVRIAGELYSITNIAFSSVPFEPGDPFVYTVMGLGSLHRTGEALLEQSMTLDVDINDRAGVHVESGVVNAGSGWPTIDITGREPTDDDTFQFYWIHIAAAPRPEPVLYELVAGDPATQTGSFFLDVCTFCGRLDAPIPMAGTFLLRPTGGGGPDPRTFYAVEAFDIHTIRTTPPWPDYKITGAGTYEWGGEVALLQSMDLTVDVNDDKGAVLSSGNVTFTAGMSFPDIEIRLEHQNPVSDLHVYSLDLVARPAVPKPSADFRRGDANSDGSGDISDAVFILLWRFAGGAAPSCLEAADANADGKHDISDAVSFLLHLFQGGPAPPAPGAETCGPAKQYFFGCESLPPCAGG